MLSFPSPGSQYRQLREVNISVNSKYLLQGHQLGQCHTFVMVLMRPSPHHMHRTYLGTWVGAGGTYIDGPASFEGHYTGVITGTCITSVVAASVIIPCMKANMLMSEYEYVSALAQCMMARPELGAGL